MTGSKQFWFGLPRCEGTGLPTDKHPTKGAGVCRTCGLIVFLRPDGTAEYHKDRTS